MLKLNRTIVLNTLIKHETLVFGDLSKKENLGLTPDTTHLQLLVNELIESEHVHQLDGVMPATYSITDKGIREGKRLAQEV